MSTALIFGITGQDGSYLSELLLAKDYKVYGVARRTSTPNHERIRHIMDNKSFEVLTGDVTDPHSVTDALNKAFDKNSKEPLVAVSFNQPKYTWDVVAVGTLNILEGIRSLNLPAYVRYYQAGSSEMFGASLGELINTDDSFAGVRYRQNEFTPFNPQSPYAIAKVAAHQLTKLYRTAYGMFTCNGVLFNHESERRGDNFVTRKVTQYIAKLHTQAALLGGISKENIAKALQEVGPLALGNLQSYRDWGHAEDYVKAMWLMLQQSVADDYVIATGETHSVREFVVTAFTIALGYYSDSFVTLDESLLRPAEVNYLCGNYSKAAEKLGWKPEVKFPDLVKRMLLHDVNVERNKFSLPKAEYYYE
jgi:GDPmannose 4,6-dehydratase